MGASGATHVPLAPVLLARRGGGSLCASIFTEDEDFAARATFGLAPYHDLDSAVSDELKGELDAIRAGIIDGSISVKG